MVGKYPRGKLNDHDEGQVMMAVRQEGDVVVVDFGKPVAWFGMPPKLAAELASSLLRHAREVARRTGDVITFEIN